MVDSLGKLWFFQIFLFVFGTVLSFGIEGSFALHSTALNGAISESDTSIVVDSAGGFDPTPITGQNILYIEGERVEYSGIAGNTITVTARGTGGSDARSHPDGARIYSHTTGILNTLMSFQSFQSGEDSGGLASFFGPLISMLQVGGVVLRAIPQLISWDFAWMTGNWVMFRYFGWILGAAMVLQFFITMVARR